MARIEFGVSLSEYYGLEELVAVAKRVEALGFDSLWLTENIYPGTAQLEPLIALAAIAAHTERLELGPGVLILPFRNPIGLAHAAATVDRLSGGRLLLGVGAGGESREAFEAYGVPMSERGARCDESLEIMRRIWTGERVSFHGRFWRFDDYALAATPTRKPHPPIWMAGARADTVLRRAARYGDALYPTRLSPEALGEVYERLGGHGEAIGRDMSGFVRGVYLRLCLADEVQEAERRCRSVLERRYRAPVRVGEERAEASGHFLEFSRHELLGPVSKVIDSIGHYVEAGARYVVVDTSCPREQIPDQLARFMEEVRPQFA